MTPKAVLKRSIAAPAIAVLLFALPAWGKKKPPEFTAIEITRFSEQPGAEVPPNFLDYLYEALFQSPGLREVFARAVVENEVVSPSEAPQTVTLRGVIVEYGKGSHAKSLIGFGIGRRSLVAQITLFRRMDNATVYTTQIKVRSQKTLNEKLLAVLMAKEVGNRIKEETKEIRAALLEADRRYVPPPAETAVVAPAETKPALPPPAPAPAQGPTEAAAAEPEGRKAPQPAAGKDASPEPAESEPSPELGTVEVSSNIEGAEVYVNDGFVGNAPARVKLTPGKHTVRVVVAGQNDWTRELSVLPGSELKLFAQHTAKAPAPKAPAPAPAPDPRALSKQEILDLLANFVPNARITELVARHGIKFKPTPADLVEIEDAGGDSNLLATLRKAAAPTQ